MQHILHHLRALLLPQQCMLCETPTTTHTLCAACTTLLQPTGCACPQCALPLAQPAICGACLRQAPPWHQAHVPFVYEAHLRYLVHQFKFSRQLHIGATLGILFTQSLAEHRPLPDFIIPVPLHKKRLVERQFNQSLLLAKAIGKQLKIPIKPNLCQRVKNTESQTGMNAKQRAKNLRGAFVTRHGTQVTGKHIAIVDDVYTTGATLSALCKVLQKHKPKQVDVWCIARTIKS